MLVVNYSMEVEGFAEKEVICEACGEAYSYRLHRKATGNEATIVFLFTSWAKRRAEKRAKRNLSEKLAKDHDNVPCPHCGRQQSAILTAIREMSLVGLRNLGTAFIYLGVALSALLLIWLAISVIVLQNPLPEKIILIDVTIMMLFVFGTGFGLRAIRCFLLLFSNRSRSKEHVEMNYWK